MQVQANGEKKPKASPVMTKDRVLKGDQKQKLHQRNLSYITLHG